MNFAWCLCSTYLCIHQPLLGLIQQGSWHDQLTKVNYKDITKYELGAALYHLTLQACSTIQQDHVWSSPSAPFNYSIATTHNSLINRNLLLSQRIMQPRTGLLVHHAHVDHQVHNSIVNFLQSISILKVSSTAWILWNLPSLSSLWCFDCSSTKFCLHHSVSLLYIGSPPSTLWYRILT